MYSLSTRMNVVLYNMMIGMITMGFVNYLTGRYGTSHEIKDTYFNLTKLDLFIHDKYLDEHALAF